MIYVYDYNLRFMTYNECDTCTSLVQVNHQCHQHRFQMSIVAMVTLSHHNQVTLSHQVHIQVRYNHFKYSSSSRACPTPSNVCVN